MTELQSKYRNALLSFQKQEALTILKKGVDELGQSNAIDALITQVLKDVGEEWVKGELAISQVYMSARISEELCEELFGHAEEDQGESTLAISTLSDYHQLGKRIMCSVLRASGYKIIDLGSGISPDALVELIIEGGIKHLLISTLMLPTALQVLDLRNALKARNYHLEIMVGGAPFNFDKKLHQQVGADAVGHSAKDAMEWINARSGRSYLRAE